MVGRLKQIIVNRRLMIEKEKYLSDRRLIIDMIDTNLTQDMNDQNLKGRLINLFMVQVHTESILVKGLIMKEFMENQLQLENLLLRQKMIK